MAIDTINETAAKFPTLFARAARRVDYEGDLAKTLESIQAEPDATFAAAPAQAGRLRQDAMCKAVATWMTHRITQHFPLIDQSLLNRRRYITVAFGASGPYVDNDTTIVPSYRPKSSSGVPLRYVEIPLLVRYLEEWSRGWGSRGEGVIRLGGCTAPGRGTVDVCATFPGGIGPVQYGARHEAAAVVYESMAAVLRTRGAGLMEAVPSHPKPNFLALWIPETERLTFKRLPNPSPKPADPAYVMEYANNTYLLSLWDAPGERPLEAMLREFTTGPFPAHGVPA